MTTPTVVPLILCGGAGTRLWPLSREAAPKPFMQLPDGDTLLAKTVARAVALPRTGPLLTVTNRDYYFATKDVYAALPGGAPADAAFLLEPFGRGTAAAVALGALWAETHVGADVPLLVLAADHLIRDQQGFAAGVERAAALARSGQLVTFGINPTLPETGFGYIECGAPLDAGTPPALAVARFIEKPPRSDAERYVVAGNYVWNSGMFCFTPRTILAALALHAPAVLDGARAAWRLLASAPRNAMLEIDPATFASVPDISLDYAVMEKAAGVAVVRAGFDWSDVGSWQAVSNLVPTDDAGNSGQGERVSIDTRGTYIHAEDRVVAAVGVEDLVIVDTADAVLVAHRSQLQRVKEVVGELKARGHDAYRLHKTVARPWGAYTVLQEGPGFKIKRLEVKPGGKLSLQLHHRRSEHWVVVAGIAHVTRGDDTFDIRPNESTYLPIETRHRLENRGSEPLIVIEVACGDYIGEDDIVRFDDQYGRVPG